jgi:photosystem II stability/assembly factor-like uncharacterized protein
MRWPARASASLAAAALAALAASPAPGGPRDVLDTPATRSALAARTLVNGIARAGSRLVAVGQRGHVLVSDDAGSTWKQAQVPVSSDLVAVSFPSPRTGWAVGHDGVVLRTQDGGLTWARQLDGRAAGARMVEFYASADAPSWLEEARRFAAQGAENPYLDVCFEDERTGYVVGAFGLILRTTDAGASWTPWMHLTDNPKLMHLYAVRRVGSELYAVGEQGLALRLDRAAGRFRALEMPYKGTLFGVTGSERAVLAHGLRGTVLRSADSGRSWQRVETGLQVGLTGSAAADGRILVVSQAGHLLESRDDGASFRPVPMKGASPAAAVALAGEAVVIGGPRGLSAHRLP